MHTDLEGKNQRLHLSRLTRGSKSREIREKTSKNGWKIKKVHHSFRSVKEEWIREEGWMDT